MLYNKDEQYFILRQIIVREGEKFHFVVDTENTRVESRIFRGTKLELIYKEDRIAYVWSYGPYHISGKCNLGIEELQKILNGLSL